MSLYRLPLLGLLLLVFASGNLCAQVQEEEKDNDIVQRNNAITLGLYKHTFGWGGQLQYRRSLPNPRIEIIGGITLASYKNRDENVIPSGYEDQGGSNYIFGKLNYLYVSSFTLGMQYVLIQRTEFTRIQLKSGFSLGPDLALLKPYFLDVLQDLGNGNIQIVTVQYQGEAANSPTKNGLVFGESDFFQGFDQIKAQIGLKLKWDLTLDLSGSSFFTKGLVLGVQYDLFPKPVPVMLGLPNSKSYLGLNIGFMAGNAW